LLFTTRLLGFCLRFLPAPSVCGSFTFFTSIQPCSTCRFGHLSSLFLVAGHWQSLLFCATTRQELLCSVGDSICLQTPHPIVHLDMTVNDRSARPSGALDPFWGLSITEGITIKNPHYSFRPSWQQQQHLEQYCRNWLNTQVR
jgi:hypothetical protein